MIYLKNSDDGKWWIVNRLILPRESAPYIVHTRRKKVLVTFWVFIRRITSHMIGGLCKVAELEEGGSVINVINPIEFYKMYLKQTLQCRLKCTLIGCLDWVNLSKRGGKDGVSRGLAGLLRGISQGRSPREILRSSPISPRKIPSFPSLLLRFTFYF